MAAVGEMAAEIAHEINNPLTVINGHVLMLKRHLQDQDNEQQEKLAPHIEKISLMSGRIVKIINGLKLVSRDGSIDPMIEFSIPKMLYEIKSLVEIKVNLMNIKLDIQIDESVDMAYGREVQISQVLVNLINNSVDAISNQNEKWIKLLINDKFDFLEFSITDSGTGIPKEIRDKIMTPFYTTKKVGKGTGLGLSISSGIIKDHGGELNYNEKNPNTQFTFAIYKALRQKIAS